jgi:phospholipid/cholesterol/gamma-HCH transport system substrate-binding protein
MLRRRSANAGSAGRAGVVVGLVVAVTLAGCSLQTTGALKGNLHLSATFPDVQQLAPGEAIEISDVQVGSVTSIHLRGYQAVVNMSIKDGTRIPKGTVALLTQTSLLGEQYIDLQFPSDYDRVNGPWVRSGEVLPPKSTEGLEIFAGKAADVLGAITSGDLASAVRAIYEGIGGRGPEINEIIAQLSKLLDAVSAQQPAITATIDGLAKLGSSLAGGTGELTALIDNLTSTTGVFATDRQKLITALSELTTLSTTLNNDVIQPHLGQIESLLNRLDPVLGELVASRPLLEKLINGLKAFVDIVPRARFGDALELFAWVAGLMSPNGQTHPLPVTTILSPRKSA